MKYLFAYMAATFLLLSAPVLADERMKSDFPDRADLIDALEDLIETSAGLTKAMMPEAEGEAMRILVSAGMRLNFMNSLEEPYACTDPLFDETDKVVLSLDHARLRDPLRHARITMIAESQLKYADEALAIGCLNVADEQYRSIISKITAPRYASFRQRAQIGVDDVRDAKRAR